MKRNMKQWLDDLRSAPRKQALPVLSFPSVQLLGTTVRELIASSSLQARGMAAVAARTPAAGAVSLMDLSVEAECFGAPISVSDDEVPTVTAAVAATPEAVAALPVPPVGAGRTPIYLDAMRQAAELIADRPAFAGIIGPYSLAGRLLDVNEIMILCYENPEMVHAMLKKAAEFLSAYALAYKETGANGIVMAEPLSGLLSPDLEAEFSAPYVRQIAETVQDDNFIVIYHNCGNNTPDMTASIYANGCAAYHFGNAVSMNSMLQKAPADLLVMGNIDPAGEFRNGTPESIRKATLALLRECSSYPNFVVSSGCDIPPLAKWENIDAFFAAVNEFYGG